MSNVLQVVGVVGCLAVGVGGGFAVRAMAEVVPAKDPVVERGVSASRLRVSALTGTARVLSPSGVWRPARREDSVKRPSGFELPRGVSSLTLASADTTLMLAHGARGTLNADDQALRIQLEDGHVVVQSVKDVVTVVVGRDGSEISGRSFGVKVEDGRVLVAGISKEVDLKRRGRTTQIAAASEGVYSAATGFRQLEMPESLSVNIDRSQRQDGRWQVSGRTSPSAWVLVRNERNAYQAVSVDAEGRFSASISSQQPLAGELLVFDAAGRTAEVGVPSGPLGSGGARRRVEPAEAPPPSRPDPLFPDDEPAARPTPAPVATKAPASPKPTAQPASRPKRPAREDGDSITLDEETPKEPATKTVPAPKTETPPPVEPPAAKPEKVPAKPKPEDDDEVKLDW